MKSIGIGMPEELIDEIDRERARKGLRTGDTPSRSAWIRRAVKREMHRTKEYEEDIENSKTAEV